MPAQMDKLDPKLQRILMSYPVRNNVKWSKRKGIAVITYPKRLTKFELWLRKFIGGPIMIQRTMDEKSTVIWELSDGRNSIKDICDVMDELYREEIEPVFEYVHKVLVVLLERNLLHLEHTKPEHPLPNRKQRVIKKPEKLDKIRT